MSMKNVSIIKKNIELINSKISSQIEESKHNIGIERTNS